VVMLREGAGREASPTAAIIDTQSVKTTESGGPRGWDAVKRLKGRKRHIAVDTDGLVLGILVHAADIQDADGLGDLLKRLKPDSVHGRGRNSGWAEGGHREGAIRWNCEAYQPAPRTR
jgi:Transposase DDE domain